jgi:hypothetical protein
MFTTIRVNLAVGVGLGLLAACGPGQHTPAATSLHDQAAPVWHRLVQCARQNGMPDLPDPTIDDQGQAQFPDGLPQPPDTVRQACQAIYDQLPAQVRGGTGGATPDVAQLRQFAQCMRRQGITDWPDPDSNGNFPFPPSLAGNLKTGPRWPQISAAWNGPCKRYNPAGHISAAPQ